MRAPRTGETDLLALCLIVFVASLMALPLALYFGGPAGGMTALATAVISALLARIIGED